MVRVLIDVAFAFLYFLSGVKGWLGNSLDLAHDPISSDPWFQNLLVPLLMVAPLWWRFQQNLRRSYETRQRYAPRSYCSGDGAFLFFSFLFRAW